MVEVPTGGGTREASLKDLEASKTMESYKEFGAKHLSRNVMRSCNIIEHIEKRITKFKASELVKNEQR